MLHKFYIVVDDPEHKLGLHQELEAVEGHETVPERPVDIVNPMPHSEYNSVAMLTQEEADTLISDLRVRDVHRDPYELGVKKGITGTRTGNWRKNTTFDTTDKNWGLVRCISTSDNFTVNYGNTTSNFTYNLNGTGVDFVIMDTGIEPNHPEFAVNADGTGGSRVVNYDWTQHGIIASTPVGGFLGDCDGHGSNCASIAAGNTNGWAPGAAIYSLRSVGTGATTEYDITDGRQLDLLDDFEVWQTLRAWHNAKPVTSTGYKRPTVVNCSFGFFITYKDVSSITYRGTTYSVSTTTGQYGTMGVNVGVPVSGVHGFRYTALEAEITSTMNAGVIVVGAAGNDSHKIDVPGGLDYDNYYYSPSRAGNYFYHRGSTPSATPGVISVGCMAAYTNNNFVGGTEHKRGFSCCGPRVDIWAPGDSIMGAYANAIYNYASVADPRSATMGTGYTYYLNKIDGTSQASPQVAGVVTCLLEARPWMTPTEVKNWTTSTASTWSPIQNYYTNSPGYTYTQLSSLQGGPAKALYQPFNNPIPLKVNG